MVMILYETCKSKKAVTTVTSHSDTAVQINYIYYRDSSKSKPIYLRGSRDTIFENRIEFRPSDDYKTLVNQFDELKQILLSKNVYIDSLVLDSLGWVKITDTLQKNAILGRSYSKNIVIPNRTNTITNTVIAPKRREVYFGGSVFATPFSMAPNNVFGRYTRSAVTNVGAGFLYKDKRDMMIGAGMQYDGKDINYGVSSYIKLSFRKTNK